MMIMKIAQIYQEVKIGLPFKFFCPPIQCYNCRDFCNLQRKVHIVTKDSKGKEEFVQFLLPGLPEISLE